MTRILVAFGLAVLSGLAAAAIVEEQLELPVQVTDAYRKTIAHSIRVTLFRDDGAPAPRPLVVINHGRATEPRERAEMGRARFSGAARWFVQNGFVVAVPTRVGYGVTGGEDIEDDGPCNGKRYGPAFAAAAEQTLAVLRVVRDRTDVQSDRTLLVGQSFGGATTVALAALNPAGVAAAINFAGGAGGNPKTHAGRPCAPHLLERLFAEYGANAKLPMLWIYTENDQFFGPNHPKEWFDTFRKAGGTAEFVQFPPTGDDGHGLFTAFPAVWQPVVADFLRRHGYAMQEIAR